MHLVYELIGWLAILAFALSSVAITVASLMPHRVRWCEGCDNPFYAVDKYDHLCESCQRTEEILAADRCWSENANN